MNQDLKLFAKYTIPSMTGMLIAGSFSIVDTIFIGHGVGEVGLAGVGITWPLVMFCGAVGDMIGSGAGVLISQARGSNRETDAHHIFGNMLWLLLFFTGILMALTLTFLEPILVFLGATAELLPYAIPYSQVMLWGMLMSSFMLSGIAVVRNDGRPVLAMWTVITGLILNVFFDWLFIIHFLWGAAGAAWATIMSETGACLVILIYYLSPWTRLKLRFCPILPDLGTARNIIRTGLPIFGNTFAILVMLSLHNYQSMKYGNVIGLAAYTLLACLESLGSMLMTGLAAGVQPLVAYLHGAGEHTRKRKMGALGCWSALILGILMTIFCFSLRHLMPAWVGLEKETATLAAHGVLLSSWAFLFLGVIRVASYYYQSSECLIASSLLIYGDALFALPVCLLILPIYWGMDGVWLAMPISRLVLLGILLGIEVNHRQRRRMDSNCADST